MARKKHAEHANHERWLVSYADFITLLFAFFVVMFASTQSDKSKAKQISAAVEKALENGGVATAVAKILGGTVDDLGQGNAQMHGPGGAQKADKNAQPDEVIELVPSLRLLSKQLAEEIKEGKLEMHLEPRGLVVSLRDTTLFPSGEDTIDSSSDAIMTKLARMLIAIPNPVLLEGHTDSIPISTARFASNWELSTARAISVLKLLTTEYEIPATRLAVAGYADTAAIDTNDTPAGRARNRRVDVVFLSKLALNTRPHPETQKSADAPVTAKAPAKAH